ncbi:MAG: BrnA antitoxin family protein [Methylobacter sp.]|jgi:hypothetical protein|nr:BrnA antitoxin family protein [Methylobacter sp.]
MAADDTMFYPFLAFRLLSGYRLKCLPLLKRSGKGWQSRIEIDLKEWHKNMPFKLLY